MASSAAYNITYHFVNGAYWEFDPTDELPDMERTAFEENVRAVKIRAPAPLEHKIAIQGPSLDLAENDYFFNAFYFPHGEIIDYAKAASELSEDDVKALHTYAVQAIQYDHRFAGQPLKKKIQDMPYIRVPSTREVYVFNENFAVLEPLDPKMNDGKYWHKINRNALDLGMV